MKLSHFASFLVFVFLIGFFVDSAPAQIGRGRILKKIRDDIFGTEEERAKAEAKKKADAAKKKLEAQRKAQAQRNAQSGRQPTPIGSGAKSQVAPNYQPSRGFEPPRNAPQSRTPSSLASDSRSSSQRAKKPQPTRKGFGFELVDQKGKIYVSKITKDGNAADAGLKRGDQIVGLGGVDVEDKKSFDEVADVLGEGDNIEISYKRNGKVDEVLIGYGSIPETPQDEDNTIASRNNVANSAGATEQEQQIERLYQTIREQEKVIQTLRREIDSLKAGSSRANRAASVLSGPSFNSPNK